jgi:hypothetical protein
MKANATNSEKPKAVDTLIEIAELVLKYRADAKLRLAVVARVINRASGLLRYDNIDERLEVENGATVQLAKKLGLVS